jgi:hypothetical protein
VHPDQFLGNLDWSYSQWAGAETGYAIFYQLPGDQAYGVTVTFDNRPVYDEPFEIEKLTETVITKLVTQVYKLKLVVSRLHRHNSPRGMAQIRRARRKNSNNTHRQPRSTRLRPHRRRRNNSQGHLVEGRLDRLRQSNNRRKRAAGRSRRLSNDNNRQKHRLTDSPQSSPKRLHIHNMGLQQRQQNTTPQHNTHMGRSTPANKQEDLLPRNNGPDRRHQHRPIQHNSSIQPASSTTDITHFYKVGRAGLEASRHTKESEYIFYKDAANTTTT